jgi:hypothetical protein
MTLTTARVLESSCDSRWLRECADPAAHAHPQWWDALGIAQHDAALRSRAGRRLLSTRLRAAVPLPPLEHLPRLPDVPSWALAPADALQSSVDQAGWLLLAPWAPCVIARQQIDALVGCVGPARYEAVFSQPPDNVWRDGAMPRPHASSAAALREELRGLGLRAIARALAHVWPGFVSRARLLLGPSHAVGAGPALSIDTDALLRHLETPSA